MESAADRLAGLTTEYIVSQVDDVRQSEIKSRGQRKQESKIDRLHVNGKITTAHITSSSPEINDFSVNRDSAISLTLQHISTQKLQVSPTS